jgi:glycosyltransferase involved in cell wall biosynthesis
LYGPHAIDNQRFNTMSEEQQKALSKWKKDLGIDKGDFVFLFVGKMEPKKNPLLLVEAFKQISCPSAKLVFIGDGILLPNIQAAALIDSRIICLGFQNQTIMPLVYRLGNVLVLPSKGPNETWGLAMNEAMASGLPIIASDKCGGAIDLITPATGLIFESDNQTELYKSMLYYINNRSICISNGLSAQAHIQNFNYTGTINSLQLLINQF